MKKWRDPETGKRYSIDILAEQIANGDELSPEVPARAAELARNVARQLTSSNNMIRITGTIQKQTDGAVLFCATNGVSSWVPKSQAVIYFRGIGPADQIEISEQLAKLKGFA